MYEKIIESMRIPCNQDEFLNLIYQGYSKYEAMSKLKIAPIAIDRICEEDSIFAGRLHRAEGFYADIQTDKLYTLHEEFDDPRMVEAVSKNIQWMAKTRKRDRYGDKTENTNTTQINLSIAMSDARKRVLEYIDVKPLNINETQTDNISVEQRQGHMDALANRPYVDPLS